MTSLRELLDDHVFRFNQGVRTGDFGPMLERLTDDAELAFEGVPVGPFAGREAIAAAYRERPPDDEIAIVGVPAEDGDRVIADYAWSRDPRVRAGELELDRRDDRICRLVVRFA